MSSLLGKPGDRWPLSHAIDALTNAARRAGRPSWIWLVGIVYPGLNVTFDLVGAVIGVVARTTGLDAPRWIESHGLEKLLDLFGPMSHIHVPRGPAAFFLWLVLFPLFLALFRLAMGLALAAGSADQQAPTLARAWTSGRELAASGLGMWVLLVFLLFTTMVVVLGPVILLLNLWQPAELSAIVFLVLLPFLLLLFGYAVVLQVVNQLALHSLAQNRRGVASALNHAWRLVRHSPWSALRATLVDIVLFASVLFLRQTLEALLGDGLAGIPVVALFGFAGVARAFFWARAYRGLGGLSAAEGIPGL